MKFNRFCSPIMLLVSLIPTMKALQSIEARVRVQITDAYGNAIPAKQITLTGDDGTIRVPQNEPFTAKYGHYTLEVKMVPGASNASQPVVIDQPEQILTVAMKLGMMEAQPPHCSIVGRVIPETGALRIRSTQLFGAYSADVPVAPDGTFEFRDLECGDYLLIAMGAKGCLGTRTFRAVPAAGHADIRLTPGTACTSAAQ